MIFMDKYHIVEEDVTAFVECIDYDRILLNILKSKFIGGCWMSQYNFRVSLEPKRAADLIKDRQTADLVYEESFDLDKSGYIATLIFEKYYFRASNRAALIVLIDNTKGYTDIRSISTGSSQGMIFNFDWGAADDFAYSVKETLKEYIIK